MTDLLAVARRHWQISAALAVFAVFAAVHTAAFGPALKRYRAVVRQAAELGMPVDPAAWNPGMPAAVSALLANNSLNAALAEEQGNSGTLTAELLDDLTWLAARDGLAVLSTEQGMVTQLPGSVQVRAHVRMRGSYAAFVRFLRSAAESRILLSVDRFSMRSPGAGPADIEAWVTRLVLKRRTGAR
jgi:hypothetical protein